MPGLGTVKTITLKASEVRAQWGRLLGEDYLRRKRVVIERRGIPVAAIVPLEDVERLERLDAQRERFFESVDRMREAFKDVPDDELEREVQKAVAEAREELYGPAASRRQA